MFTFTSTVQYMYVYCFYNLCMQIKSNTMYIEVIHVLFFFTSNVQTNQDSNDVHATLLHLDLFNKHSLKKPLVFLARVI